MSVVYIIGGSLGSVILTLIYLVFRINIQKKNRQIQQFFLERYEIEIKN